LYQIIPGKEIWREKKEKSRKTLRRQALYLFCK
jgi:hypothetical protein